MARARGRGRGRGRGETAAARAARVRRQQSIDALTPPVPADRSASVSGSASASDDDDDHPDSEYGHWSERSARAKGKGRARSRSRSVASSTTRSRRSTSAGPSSPSSSPGPLSPPSPSSTPHIPSRMLRSQAFYLAGHIQSYRDSVKTLCINEADQLAKRLLHWDAQKGGLRWTRIGREERADVWRRARAGETGMLDSDDDEGWLDTDRPLATRVQGRLYDRSAETFTLWPLPPASAHPSRWSLTDELEALNQRLRRPTASVAGAGADDDDGSHIGDVDEAVLPAAILASQDLLDSVLLRLADFHPIPVPHRHTSRRTPALQDDPRSAEQTVGNEEPPTKRARKRRPVFESTPVQDVDVHLACDPVAQSSDLARSTTAPSLQPSDEANTTADAPARPPSPTIASLALQDFPLPRKAPSHLIDGVIDPSLLDPALFGPPSASGLAGAVGEPESSALRSGKRKQPESETEPTEPAEGAEETGAEVNADAQTDAVAGKFGKWEYGLSWVQVLQAARDVGVDNQCVLPAPFIAS